MNQVEALRKTFNDQLNETVTQLAALQRNVEFLVSKREQLKGAVFALDSLAAPAPEAPAAPAPEVAPAPEQEAPAAEASNG